MKPFTPTILSLILIAGLPAWVPGKESPAKADPVEALKAKAKAGDSQAQVELGGFYLRGSHGVKKDMAEAVKWFRKSAEQGNAQGQAYFGYAYLQGWTVQKDGVEAAKWFKKSAEQGFPMGQLCLAGLYEAGIGVEKNLVEAAKLYRLAAEQRDPEAEYHLGVMLANGKGIDKSSEEAAKWFRKAAEQGWMSNARASYGAADPTEALAWLYVARSINNDAPQPNSTKQAEPKQDVILQRIITLEKRLGDKSVLAAKQRAKDIQADIDANKLKSSQPKASKK